MEKLSIARSLAHPSLLTLVVTLSVTGVVHRKTSAAQAFADLPTRTHSSELRSARARRPQVHHAGHHRQAPQLKPCLSLPVLGTGGTRGGQTARQAVKTGGERVHLTAKAILISNGGDRVTITLSKL